jgi:hypothetical protein
VSKRGESTPKIRREQLKSAARDLPTAPPPLFEYRDGKWQAVEPEEDDLRG